MSERRRCTTRCAALRLLAGALVAGLASAAVAEPESISFADAVRLALERNITLRRSSNDLTQLEIAVSESRMQYWPDLRLSASASQSVDHVFDAQGQRSVSFDNRGIGVGLSSSYVLFDGFSRPANLEAAQLDLEGGEHAIARVRQTVVFLVISGFLSVIESGSQLRVSEESVAAEAQLQDMVRKLVDAGRSPISDLYQQQANLARAELARVAARRTLALARIDLTQILQLDPRQEYVFEAPLLPDSITVGDPPRLEVLLENAFDRRDDLKALELRIQSSLQSERAAAAGYWPSLSLSADYRTSYTSASADGFLEQVDDRRSGNVGIGLSYALFDRQSRKRSVQRARLGTEDGRIALQDLRQTIAFEVQRAVLDEEAARQSLDAARAQLRAARRALESTRQRYEAGASTLVEVTLSRADFVDAQSVEIRAGYTLLWQQYFRDYYVGTLDPGMTSLP